MANHSHQRSRARADRLRVSLFTSPIDWMLRLQFLALFLRSANTCCGEFMEVSFLPSSLARRASSRGDFCRKAPFSISSYYSEAAPAVAIFSATLESFLRILKR